MIALAPFHHDPVYSFEQSLQAVSRHAHAYAPLVWCFSILIASLVLHGLISVFSDSLIDTFCSFPAATIRQQTIGRKRGTCSTFIGDLQERAKGVHPSSYCVLCQNFDFIHPNYCSIVVTHSSRYFFLCPKVKQK
jgi:hypothetical protein